MANPEYKALDSLRTRISQLSASINLLRHELESSPQLPSWQSLQTASSNLAANLQSLSQTLASNRPLLTSAHAYPNPTFPGLTQEAFLQQLLRKKMDPRAEDWIDRELDKQPDVMGEDRGELWDWAGGVVKEMKADLQEGLWDDYFTVEERRDGVRGVETGIRRALFSDDEDNGEEGGEDEVMGEDEAAPAKEVEAKGKVLIPPPMPLENLLKFMTGSMPMIEKPKT